MIDKQKFIEILKMDGLSEDEAVKHYENGTIIFDDLEENFENYTATEPEYYKEALKNMIDTKEPMDDWGIVQSDNKTYYIIYKL